MSWTPERCNILRAMYAEGLSGGQIAMELKITRNAVIGKVNRLGLTRDFHASPQARGPKAQPKHRPQKRVSWKPSIRLPQIEPDPEPVDVGNNPPLRGAGVALLDLRQGQCRWPYGDGPFVFCGRPTDGIYCAGHMRMAYQAPQRRRAA